MTLLDALKELQKRVSVLGIVPYLNQGICGNVENILGCYDGRIDELTDTFLALGLDNAYPLNGHTEYWHLVGTRELWVGAQREARLALIAKCISHLEWRALAAQEANHA